MSVHVYTSVMVGIRQCVTYKELSTLSLLSIR